MAIFNSYVSLPEGTYHRLKQKPAGSHIRILKLGKLNQINLNEPRQIPRFPIPLYWLVNNVNSYPYYGLL